uniref:Uncharacterized protein n=1 Tax=Meloidogyne hapla TaxID=6305 RepID=A0A1I8BUJ9_MELHA
MASIFSGRFMFPNNTARLKHFLFNVGNNVISTSEFLADYIPKKLNTSIAVEKLIVVDTIKNYPGNGEIHLDNYTKVADIVYNSLKQIGHKKQGFEFYDKKIFN